MKRLFSALLGILLIATSASVWAANCGSGPFYVSSSIGSISNNGISPSTPWKHHPWDILADGNELCTLGPGNTVYMRRGDVWIDSSLATAASGTSDTSRITTSDLEGFGTGANPLISASWDTSGYDTGWINDGGNVWHRPVTATVNLVVYDGVILVKDSGTSPSANKWYWAANVLYVNVGGDPSSTTKWKVGHRTSALNINHNYVTMKNISFESANGVSLGGMFVQAGTTGVIIDGAVYRYGGINALSITSPTNIEVKNCDFAEIKQNNGTMVKAMLYVTSPTTSLFHNNTITGGAIGMQFATGATGINSIYDNTITGQVNAGAVAYGIKIDAGTNYSIFSNSVHDFIAATNDATYGIYTASNSNNIYSNTIYNLGIGSGGWAMGIYIKSDSNNVYSNLINDTDYIGIYVDSADLNNIYNNDVFDCGKKTVDGSDWIYYGDGGAGLGIYVVGSSENNNVYRNYVYDNYGGITQATTSGGGNNKYYYNVVVDSIVNGMGVGSDGVGANPSLFYNNTIIHSTSVNNTPEYRGHGLFMQNATEGGGNAVFANNIIYMNVKGDDTHAIWIQADNVTTFLNSLKIDNNNIYATESGAIWGGILGNLYTTGNDYLAEISTLGANITGLDGVQANAESHSIITDPKFRSTTDFRLQPSSTCINTGTNVGLTTDFLGYAINGIPDIGAYESYYTLQRRGCTQGFSFGF